MRHSDSLSFKRRIIKTILPLLLLRLSVINLAAAYGKHHFCELRHH